MPHFNSQRFPVEPKSKDAAYRSNAEDPQNAEQKYFMSIEQKAKLLSLEIEERNILVGVDSVMEEMWRRKSNREPIPETP